MSSPRRQPRLEIVLLFIILLLLLIVLAFVWRRNCCCCKTDAATTVVQVGSWNILLPKPVPDDTIAAVISAVEKQLLDSLVAQGYAADGIRFKPYYCPCDSLLINLGVTYLGETGGSKVPPPGTPASFGTQGGSGFVVSVQYDHPLAIPEIEDRQSFILTLGPRSRLIGRDIQAHPQAKEERVAVIDSGIDSVYFNDAGANYFLAKEKNGIYNFLPFAPLQNNWDDDTVMHHGTLVTAGIIESGDPALLNLQIMELKALDSTGRGTSFSASCALSYAIRQKVKLINASWGYYGGPDSILLHYIGLCATHSIPVVAAAGNVRGLHNFSLINYSHAKSPATSVTAGAEAYPNPAGSLSAASGLFYPACFSMNLPYVVSVTGLNDSISPHLPCYYQNYSGEYVSVGVVNLYNCCSYLFTDQGVEGSSFEAPVVSGQLATGMAVWRSAAPDSAIRYIQGLTRDRRLASYVREGYVQYGSSK